MSGGVRFKLSDCSPELRRRLESVLARSGGQPLSGHGQGAENAPTVVLPPVRGIQKKAKGPNKTEMRFNSDYLERKGVFEGMSFALPGGGRYKPDFITFDNGEYTAWEIKGSYRFPSESSALRGFRAARAAWTGIKFRWFVVNENGWFVEKHEEK